MQAVEVTGDVPVAALEMSDGSVAVPSFVGVLGPVHPWGVIGEVSVEMKDVQNEEDGGGEEENDLGGLKDAGWTGVRAVHVLMSVNAGLRLKTRAKGASSEYYKPVTEVRRPGRTDGAKGNAVLIYLEMLSISIGTELETARQTSGAEA